MSNARKPIPDPVAKKTQPLDIPPSSKNDTVSIEIITAAQTRTYSANLEGNQDAQLSFGQLPADGTLRVTARGMTFTFTPPTFPNTIENNEAQKVPQPTTLKINREDQNYLPGDEEIFFPIEISDSPFAINESLEDAHGKSTLREQRKNIFAPKPQSNKPVPHEMDALLHVQSEPDKVSDWLSWAGNSISDSFNAVADKIDYALDHPGSVAKSVLTSAPIAIIGAVTALPTALNALVFASGKSPEFLGEKWWNDMDNGKRAFSVLNATSSLGINFIMNTLFLPTAWNKFKATITHTFDSPKDFLDNVFSIVFGLGGAVAAAAIAYNAFLWLPLGYATAAIPALISFMVTLASRYIGVKNVFKRIHNWFNDDAAAQAKFAEALDHIDEKYLEQIQESFVSILENLYEHCEIYSTDIEPTVDNIQSMPFTTNTAYVQYEDKFYYVNKLAKECSLIEVLKGQITDLPSLPASQFRTLTPKELETIYEMTGHSRFNQPLTAAEFEHVAGKLADVLSQLAEANPDLLKDPATAEYIAKYAGMIFDFTFALGLIGYPASLTFMQKGFDGVSTAAKFAGTDLSAINPWLKRLIGAVPGLATGMLYSDAGSKLRATLAELANHLYENPKDLPFALTLLAANGFALTGPLNVAAGVTANKNNVIGVHQGTDYAEAFIGENGLGGLAVNGESSIKKAFLSTNKDAVHVKREDLSKHLHKINDNLVNPATAAKFKLFHNTVEKKSIVLLDPEDPELRRAQSAFLVV